MKTCTKCHVQQDLSQYGPRKRDGVDSMCRPCRRAYDREAYANNRTRRREQIDACDRRRRELISAWVAMYLVEHPCVDCGEADPVVLEFDHVRGAKLGNVAEMRYSGNLRQVQDEIAKCEVRCANCHRRVTHARRLVTAL